MSKEGKQQKIPAGIRLISAFYKTVGALFMLFLLGMPLSIMFDEATPKTIITFSILVGLGYISFRTGQGLFNFRKKDFVFSISLASFYIGLVFTDFLIGRKKPIDVYPALITLVFAIVNIFIIIYLTRPKVKEQFR